MHSSLPSDRSHSHAPVAIDHPAESFLRSANFHYTRSQSHPNLLLMVVDFDGINVRAGIQHVRGQSLLTFLMTLPFCAADSRTRRETARLCQLLNADLPAGHFFVDELDGEISFRNGHFYDPAGLDPASFRLFIEHNFAAVGYALPAFASVVCDASAAVDAIVHVAPPSSS